ncbi:hypothetical protein, partial [Enterocloster citroniae]|uniref:hypothetical protein n=2 Tax=Enterocloster citroniae TaxID=358743 RepID=UPI00349EB04B
YVRFNEREITLAVISLLYYMKGKFSGIPYDIKNAPRKPHCGGRENAAEAARCRRRILEQDSLFFIDSFSRR